MVGRGSSVISSHLGSGRRAMLGSMTDMDFQPWLDRWRLTADGPGFSTKFGSRLLPVAKDGVPAMLKIAEGEEERRGGALMAWWDGVGAAKVLAADDPAILLERLSGPSSLAAMAADGRDAEATAILCEAPAGLHAPPRRGAPARRRPPGV